MRSMICRRLGCGFLAVIGLCVGVYSAEAQSAKSTFEDAIAMRDAAKTPDEMKLAVSAFELAAALGENRALLMLGNLHAGMQLGQSDEVLAKAFYDLAAEHGLRIEALRGTAALYRSKSGAYFDPGQALALYEDAAALDDQDSRIAAAELLVAGAAPTIDEKKAGSFFEQAIKNGAHPSVSAKLASLYRSREGGLYDPVKAKQLYEAAAAGGDVGALIVLGQMHAEGELGAADEAAAQHYYEQALEKSEKSDASYRLARLYQSPEGALYDINKAIAYFDADAKAGNARANIELAKIFAGGQGVPADEDRSETYLTTVMATLEADASRVMGDIYNSPGGSKHDVAKALTFYRRAAELGDSGAMVVMGDAFANGTGVTQDEEQALGYYDIASRNNLTGGVLRRIAGIYRTQAGVLFDVARAIDYYQRAAALGDGRAMLALGEIYSTGENKSVDEQRAEQYFTAAVIADKTLEPTALRNQAALYRSNSGALYDIAKAEALFQASAALGDTQAMVALGEMYSTGEFTGAPKQTPQ